MHFQIASHGQWVPDSEQSSGYAQGPVQFSWQLERADGSVVCQSAEKFDSERELRSQLAKDKKSMAGATRYKVVSPDDR